MFFCLFVVCFGCDRANGTQRRQLKDYHQQAAALAARLEAALRDANVVDDRDDDDDDDDDDVTNDPVDRSTSTHLNDTHTLSIGKTHISHTLVSPSLNKGETGDKSDQSTSPDASSSAHAKLPSGGSRAEPLSERQVRVTDRRLSIGSDRPQRFLSVLNVVHIQLSVRSIRVCLRTTARQRRANAFTPSGTVACFALFDSIVVVRSLCSVYRSARRLVFVGLFLLISWCIVR
jgi:hypothetical protein